MARSDDWHNIAVRVSDYETIKQMADTLDIAVGKLLHDAVSLYYDESYRPFVEAVRAGKTSVRFQVHVSDRIRHRILESGD